MKGILCLNTKIRIVKVSKQEKKRVLDEVMETKLSVNFSGGNFSIISFGIIINIHIEF